jgi:hypothetical protein
MSDILRELGMLPDKEYNSVENVAEELHIIYTGIPPEKRNLLFFIF